MQHMWNFLSMHFDAYHSLMEEFTWEGIQQDGYHHIWRDMHSRDDDGEVVTTTSLLIESEGELSVEPFQLNDQST